MNQPTNVRPRWLLVVAVLAGACVLSGLLVATWRFLAPAPGPVAGSDQPRSGPTGTAPAHVAVTARGDLSQAERTTIEIFRKSAPSVAYITKLAVRQDLFRRNVMAIPQGTGSGFIWDKQGHVVTNFHVIQGGQAARVTLADRSVWQAALVGYYAAKDVAVLRIDAPAGKLKPVSVGTSKDLVVGQHTFAIGNPFGLDHTLSTGVISGLGREIMSVGRRPIQGVIQTDAAINPGNSGGPLLDSAGRLIGVNTAIYSPSGASAGVGFAVPVDAIRRIVPQLIQHGRVTRPGLGIQVDEGGLAARLGLRGALVLGVIPGSGAAKAGLRPARLDPRSGAIELGDLIIGLAGEEVADTLDLYRILDRHQVGETVAVTVVRNQRRLEAKIELVPVVDE